jgi:hypothetical protein
MSLRVDDRAHAKLLMLSPSAWPTRQTPSPPSTHCNRRPRRRARLDGRRHLSLAGPEARPVRQARHYARVAGPTSASPRRAITAPCRARDRRPPAPFLSSMVSPGGPSRHRCGRNRPRARRAGLRGGGRQQNARIRRVDRIGKLLRRKCTKRSTALRARESGPFNRRIGSNCRPSLAFSAGALKLGNRMKFATAPPSTGLGPLLMTAISCLLPEAQASPPSRSPAPSASPSFDYGRVHLRARAHPVRSEAK